MVLVVLALAGSLLGICAHRTSRRALAAGVQERRLQRTWGMRSLDTACLARAEAILIEADREDRPPPAAVHRRITLGNTTFDLVVADEQAKANVNALAAERGREAIRASAGALSAGRWILQVVPRPVREKTGEIRSPQVLFASLEQVFADVSPADLLGTGPDRPGPAEDLTCWGNGKVHVRRAPPTVLREMLTGALSEYQVHRLCLLREELPDAGLEELLGRLELESEERDRLRKRLTQDSNCHSLWIVARGRTRDWHRLIVNQTGDATNDAGRWTFVW